MWLESYTNHEVGPLTQYDIKHAGFEFSGDPWVCKLLDSLPDGPDSYQPRGPIGP